jgi:hypothetical protein
MKSIIDMLFSDEYVAACKKIAFMVPAGWLSGPEATKIRYDAKNAEEAIAALLARAIDIQQLKKQGRSGGAA